MILNIDKILKAVESPISDPWDHYIVDDVFNYQFSNEDNFITDDNLYYQLTGELMVHKEKILSTYSPIRLTEDAYGHRLNNPIENTWPRVQWLKEYAYADKEIHMDDVNKIWTCVVYCYPTKCNGTVLIEGNPDNIIKSKEVEWKQNRGVIFSPGTKNYPTWHKIINQTNKIRRAIALNILSSNYELKTPSLL